MSATWSVLLTVLFLVTGVYSLWRWTGAVAARGGRRLEAAIDLNHVVMSVAMVVMVWWPGGTTATVVQSVVFAGFALALGIAVRAGDRLHRFGLVTHVVMNLAMVWMLIMMPLLMGGAHADGGGHHHGAAGGNHGGAADAPVQAMSAPGWVEPVSWIAIALMAATAVWWALRAVRAERERAHFCCHGAMGAGMAIMIAAMA